MEGRDGTQNQRVRFGRVQDRLHRRNYVHEEGYSYRRILLAVAEYRNPAEGTEWNDESSPHGHLVWGRARTLPFLDYLENLKKANKGQRIAVFMDNLSVHTSKISKEKMNDLGMRYIYNVPYSPDFNPIEMCFSVLKNTFKKLRMNNLVT